MKNNKDKIIIYTDSQGRGVLDARVEEETVWLSQEQLVLLFNKSKKTISEHIANIFKEGELDKNSVVRKFRTTASDGKRYNVNFYNLDVTISVGYRVKSKEGTKFRIWATKVLREHIIKGYTINQKRLKQRDVKLSELEKVIKLFQNTRQSKLLNQGEVEGLLQVITDYANSWVLLQKFDEGKLKTKKEASKIKINLDFERAIKSIEKLKTKLVSKKQATGIFGKDKDNRLEGILGNINQTFSGKELYPSAEEKAAHLLYFVIKDHPFVDGNKRIGSFLFILFLRQNKLLLDKKGAKKINDNALVALALLVAQSNPKDKNLMIALITNLL